jgi:UDP-N-acetylmuramate dehydrogenase
MRIQENIPLAPFTTLGVGGPARYFAEAATPDEVFQAVDWAHEKQLPLFVLGGGSNLLIADAGFRGLVLRPAIRGIAEVSEGGVALFTVGAGEVWDDFVAHAVDRNCAGIECLSGIPGLAGGTPVQNVGAYGQEVGETLRSVETLEIATGKTRRFEHVQCEFAYRSSIFNTTARGQFIILRMTFALVKGGAARLAYDDLKNRFAASNPTLLETRRAVREIRQCKGMLLVPGDEDGRSAGSFFKNPVLTTRELADLESRSLHRGLSIPTFPALAARHKISAAWMVEQAGFPKGYSLGAVGISHRHALAIVNRGGASAAEVIALKDNIRRAVHDQFGIKLQPEPVFVGFE